jgi:hypothetical protein
VISTYCISSIACNLYSFNSSAGSSTVQYTLKEKGGKPVRKPYIPSPGFKKSVHKPNVRELSRLCPETSTKLSVHEFGFWNLFMLYFPQSVEAARAHLLSDRG